MCVGAFLVPRSHRRAHIGRLRLARLVERSGQGADRAGECGAMVIVARNSGHFPGPPSDQAEYSREPRFERLTRISAKFTNLLGERRFRDGENERHLDE